MNNGAQGRTQGKGLFRIMNPIKKIFRFFIPHHQDPAIEPNSASTNTSAPIELELSEPVRSAHPPRDSENNYEEYYCGVIFHSTALPRSSIEGTLRSTIYPPMWEDGPHGLNERIAWPNWTLGTFMTTNASDFIQNSNFSHAALVDMVQNNLPYRPQTSFAPAVREPWNESYCKLHSGKETAWLKQRNAERKAEEFNPDFWNGEWFKDPKNCETENQCDPLSGYPYRDFKLLDARVYMGGWGPSLEDLKIFAYCTRMHNPQYYFAEGEAPTPTDSEASENSFSNFDGTVEYSTSFSEVSEASFGCRGTGTETGHEVAGWPAPALTRIAPVLPERLVPRGNSSAPLFCKTQSATLYSASAPEDNFVAGLEEQRPKIGTGAQDIDGDITCRCNACQMNGGRPGTLEDLRDYLPQEGHAVELPCQNIFPRISIPRAELIPMTLLPKVDAFAKYGRWGEAFQAEKKESEHAEGLVDGLAIVEQEAARETALLKTVLAAVKKSLPRLISPEVDPGTDLSVNPKGVITTDDLRGKNVGLTDAQIHSRTLAYNKGVEKQLRAYHVSNDNLVNDMLHVHPWVARRTPSRDRS